MSGDLHFLFHQSVLNIRRFLKRFVQVDLSLPILIIKKYPPDRSFTKKCFKHLKQNDKTLDKIKNGGRTWWCNLSFLIRLFLKSVDTMRTREC